MNDELGGVWKETVVAYFNVVYRYSPEVNNESLCPSCDWKLAPSEYKSEAVQPKPPISVYALSSIWYAERKVAYFEILGLHPFYCKQLCPPGAPKLNWYFGQRFWSKQIDLAAYS
jgi:hypothetical protein